MKVIGYLYLEVWMVGEGRDQNRTWDYKMDVPEMTRRG